MEVRKRVVGEQNENQGKLNMKKMKRKGQYGEVGRSGEGKGRREMWEQKGKNGMKYRMEGDDVKKREGEWVEKGMRKGGQWKKGEEEKGQRRKDWGKIGEVKVVLEEQRRMDRKYGQGYWLERFSL